MVTHRSRAVSLLEVDPDLGDGLEEAELTLAERQAVARVISLDPPSWEISSVTGDANAGWLGLFVVDGMLLRRVQVGRRSSCELFGPGDLIRPWDADGEYSPLPISVDWRVLTHTTLALLDAAFTRRIARWPQINGRLAARIAQRARSLALLGALTQLPRAYGRLLILFWLLAERWGTVSQAGIQLTLPATHEVLAMLIGTQRPAVTIALQRLDRAGFLHRSGRDRWLLTRAAIECVSRPEGLELVESGVL